MNMQLNAVAARLARGATVPPTPEAAARPSSQPKRPQVEAAPDNPHAQFIPATRKRARWIIVLAGVLVLLAGILVAKRISLYRPPVAVSYNSRLAELDTKLSRALASQLRAAGFEFDAAIVSVEGPACQRAVCLVKRLRQGDRIGLWGPMAGSHSGNGSWSFAGLGELAELKFNADAATEMRRLAESAPPEFLQVPVTATPIQSPRQAASPFNRAFELWLSARTDGRQVQWLDLETGRCLTEPEWGYFVHRLSYSHWLGSNSLDLFAAVCPDGCYWLFTRHLAVAPVDARLWDQALPDDIISHPALRSAPHSPRGSFSPARDQTNTYLFRAEEGTVGILRVLELNRASQELRIQYKLAVPAAKADT
jgi:hypothetical protein